MNDVRVLVVDDEQEKISAVVDCLTGSGLERSSIEVAQSGLAARQALAEHKFALLVVDLMIPAWPEGEPDRNGGLALLNDIIDGTQFKLPDTVIGLTQHEDIQEELAEEFRALHWALDLYDPGDEGWRDRLSARTRYLLRAAGDTEAKAFGVDLAIVTALPSELRAIRDLPWNWGTAEALDEGAFIYRGRGASNSEPFTVVSACAPRMGMVAAALLASKLIASHRPRLLAMCGICAGVKGECEIGDLLLADPCWDYQSGKIKRAARLISPDQIDVALEVRQRFDLMSEDQAALSAMHERFSGKKPGNPPRLRIGPVASGSAVLADAETIRGIKDQQHRALIGVEMEQYGVYSAAKDAGLPRPRAFGLKSVVDYATGAKNSEYQPYGAYVSANALRLFMERFGKELIAM